MKRFVWSVAICALAWGVRSAVQAHTQGVAFQAVANPKATAIRYGRDIAITHSQDLPAQARDQQLRKRPTPSGPDNKYCEKGDVPSFGSNDGPAQLPRICIYTGRDATPSPGKIVSVRKGESVDDAIAHARCGDIIELQAGTTYTGVASIPAKACDDQHWITVRTSGWRSLPSEGTRVTPCYAGAPSLRGRPAYPCSQPQNAMAKVLVASVGGDMRFLPGANHYRFIGIEFTRDIGIGEVSDLATLSTANKIIFDQTWFHGDDDSNGDETKRGIDLAQSSLVAVVDSYFNDFFCIAVAGSCTDAQAILGGLGTPAGNWGGYKIVNNFLEAAGENILFGGGGGTASPADIEIRRNHLFKPFTWMPGSSSYDGGASPPNAYRGFRARNIAELKHSVKALLEGTAARPQGRNPLMVKNLFELKNANRVLFEGNLLENVWGGFTQHGSAILLTPKNQSGQCPACFISDVTIRYNLIHKAGRALEIANVPEDRAWSSGGHNYSIHDIVADGLQYLPGCYSSSCTPYFNEFGTDSNPPRLDQVLHDVKIDHVTEVLANQRGTSLMALDGPVGAPQMYNFTVENSILPAGEYGIMNGDGEHDCAAQPSSSVPKLEACFRNVVFANNVIPYAATGAGGDWGKGNFLLPDQNAVGFVGIEDLDFHLSRSSRFKKKGRDGKDLGADIDAINTATAGVE